VRDCIAERGRNLHVLTIKRSFAFHGLYIIRGISPRAPAQRITLSRYRRLPGNIGNYGETNYSIPGRAFSGATRRAASSRLRAPRRIAAQSRSAGSTMRVGRKREGCGGVGRPADISAGDPSRVRRLVRGTTARAIRGGGRGGREPRDERTRERATLGRVRGGSREDRATGVARSFLRRSVRAMRCAGGALGRCHYAKIRSQYLIQDNHNDYTSEPPFSRARICLLSCTHVCIPPPGIPSSLRGGRALTSFSPCPAPPLSPPPPPPRGMVRAWLEVGSAPMPSGGPRKCSSTRTAIVATKASRWKGARPDFGANG